MVRRRFFFLHNPKAGGSSLRTLLGEIGKEGSVAPTFFNAAGDYRSNIGRMPSYRGFDHYFGHYGYDVFQELGDQHLLITNFRDPITRIHSLYRYWRQSVSIENADSLHENDARLVYLAKELSFSNFIRSKNCDLLLYISNFHARQLHSSGWIQRRLNKASVWVIRQRIRRMPWFFIADTPDASMVLLRHQFPEANNLTLPFENPTTRDPEVITNEDAQYLIQLNLVDYSIYSYAVMIQAARLSDLVHRIGPIDDRMPFKS